METCRVGELATAAELADWLAKQNADGFKVVAVAAHGKRLVAVVAKTNGGG